jgi:transcriptional regulator with XRE-family HTH domain
METNVLAQRLRMARAYRGWSQTELAKRADIHNMQISKLERGVIRETSTTTLRALCEALGVSPSYILGMSEDMGITEVDEAPVSEGLTPPAKHPRPRTTAPVG